jgi:hypothetical protein
MRQYALIQSPNPNQLIRAVNKALKEGWECIGGVAIFTTVLGMVDQKVVQVYVQAMTKEEKLVTP